VRFIDYGNTAKLQRQALAEMPPSLLQLRPSTFRIRIGDFEKSEETTDEMLETCMLNFIVEAVFRVTVFEAVSFVWLSLLFY